MVRNRFVQRAAGAVALGAVVLGAAGFAGHQSRAGVAPRAGSHVLNYPNVSTDWPNVVDPANVTDSQSIQVLDMLYANLVKLNLDNKVMPDLAKSWTISSDRKTYTFHLRTDAKFSDGHPITADDVIYSLDRTLNPKVYKGGPSPVGTLYLGHIVGASSYKGKGDVAGLKKIDAHTVQIKLDSPISFFLQTLSYWTADVLEKGKTPINGLTTTNPMKNQISSGPWMIKSFRYKSSMTFVPNPGYYDYKKMKLKEVDMPYVHDTQTEYQGYESGQYAMGTVPYNRLASARMDPDFHTVANLSIDYISYNFAKAPFNNKNLRLAASYAIDRDTINAKVLHGGQVTIYSLVPKGIAGYDANGKGKVPEYNPTLAKHYLALAKKEMGKSFPSTISIKYQNTSADITHEYTELQSEWKAIGLNVKIEGVPFNTWLGLVAKPTTSLTYRGGDPWIENLWIDDYPDAQDFTTNLLAPTSNYNIGNYDNPDFESMINQALTATGSKRADLYVKAGRIALKDAAWSMIGQQTSNWRWKSNITGMHMWSGEVYPMPAGHDWTNVDVM